MTTTAPGVPGPSPGAPPADPSDRLSPTGRWVRAVLTVAGVLLLLAGTLRGQDDHFPFGPFRMYAQAAKPDGVVRSARLEGVNAAGERFKLTDAATGLRRAEIEGQIPRFEADGNRLKAVAEAYHARRPEAPDLVLVEVLQRRYELKDGEPTGEMTEAQLAVWAAPGFEALADYDDRVPGDEPAIVAEAQAQAEAQAEADAGTGAENEAKADAG